MVVHVVRGWQGDNRASKLNLEAIEGGFVLSDTGRRFVFSVADGLWWIRGRNTPEVVLTTAVVARPLHGAELKQGGGDRATALCRRPANHPY